MTLNSDNCFLHVYSLQSKIHPCLEVSVRIQHKTYTSYIYIFIYIYTQNPEFHGSSKCTVRVPSNTSNSSPTIYTLLKKTHLYEAQLYENKISNSSCDSYHNIRVKQLLGNWAFMILASLHTNQLNLL